MKKFAANLTPRQIEEARRFETAGLTTYSQAVKAFERKDWLRIEEWRTAIRNRNRNRN